MNDLSFMVSVNYVLDSWISESGGATRARRHQAAQRSTPTLFVLLRVLMASWQNPVSPSPIERHHKPNVPCSRPGIL